MVGALCDCGGSEINTGGSTGGCKADVGANAGEGEGVKKILEGDADGDKNGDSKGDRDGDNGDGEGDIVGENGDSDGEDRRLGAGEGDSCKPLSLALSAFEGSITCCSRLKATSPGWPMFLTMRRYHEANG